MSCTTFHPPYNYTLHTAPCDSEKDHVFQWHLEIMPRLTIAAGFEMGTGIYINVTAPEDAAMHLREAGEDLEDDAPDAVAEKVEVPSH